MCLGVRTKVGIANRPEMGGVPRSVPFMSAGNADAQAQVKRMNLRYAGVCRTCGVELPAGTRAVYEKSTKTVLCLRCADTRTQRPVAVEEAATAEPALNHLDGVAGSSARREHERRKAARERRIRERHPKLGGVLLALSEDPQSTRAWAVGADGEERLGRRLDSVAGALVRVLHDRGIPGSRANLDHIVVCPSGVFVIDAKRYKGRPHLRKEGGLFTPRREKLIVGTRDCTRLVDSALDQAELVRDALAAPDVEVGSVLCFVRADWPLIGGDFRTRGVYVTWPRKLASWLSRPGQLDEARISALQQRLVDAFPPA